MYCIGALANAGCAGVKHMSTPKTPIGCLHKLHLKFLNPYSQAAKGARTNAVLTRDFGMVEKRKNLNEIPASHILSPYLTLCFV